MEPTVRTRDVHPDGIFGVYESLSNRFWDSASQGQHPGLRSQDSDQYR